MSEEVYELTAVEEAWEEWREQYHNLDELLDNPELAHLGEVATLSLSY